MEVNNSYENNEIFYPIVDLHEGKKKNVPASEVVQNGKNNLTSITKKNNKSKNKSSHRKVARRKIKLTLKQLSDLKHNAIHENQIDSTVENGSFDYNDAEHKDDDDDDDDNSPLKNFKKKKKRKKKKDKIPKTRLKMKSAIYPDNNLENNENGDYGNLSGEKITIKTEEGINSGFEFCTLKNVEDIKEEITSDQDEFTVKHDDNTYPKSDDESDDDDVPLSKLENRNITIEIEQAKPPPTKRKSHNSSDEDSTWGVKGVKKMKKLKVKKLKLKIKKEEISCDNGEVKPSCEECNKSFKTLKKYNIHLQRSHQKPYSCSQCPKTFTKQSKLEDHFNTHTGQRPYSCYLCEDGASFKSEASLKTHVKMIHSGNVHEKKQYPCTLCPKILSSYTCLEEHIRLHTGEKPISCKLCGKHFTRERDMKQHLNLHKEMWKCDQCEKCFLTPFKLKEHYRSHTGETPYECEKCDRKFSRVADFRYHIGTHLGLKPYGCELCGMRFTTSSSVTRHRLNMHQTGPKDHQCHICQKKFHTESRLKTHIKNHESSKSFRCDLCPAARRSQVELDKHALIHGGEFRCDTCHKGCSSAERLATHVARHDLAGKPYACFVCSLGYRSSQSLNKHLANVHKNEDIPRITPQHLCMLCGQVFDNKDKLNRHLKDSHIVLVVGEIQNIDEIEADTDLTDYKPVIKEDNEPKHETAAPPEIKRTPQIEKIDYEVAIEKDVNLRVDNPIKIPSVAAVIPKPPVLVVTELEVNISIDNTAVVGKVEVKKDLFNSPVRSNDIVEDETNSIEEENEKEEIATEKTHDDNNALSDCSDKSRDGSVANENLNAAVESDISVVVEKEIPISVVETKSLSSVRSVKSINASSLAINVPIIPNAISDSNFRVRDLSATSQLNLDPKTQKASMNRADFESPYMRIPYSNQVAQQNRIVAPSYREVENTLRQNFDSYPQMSNVSEHLGNPWFLATKSNQIPRNLIEAGRQRYGDLRMPRLETEPSEQFNHRLAATNQRQDSVLHGDRKYYYESDLHLNSDRKNVYSDAALHHQRQMNLEDVSRRKFPHIQPSQLITQELPSPRQTLRDYPGQQTAIGGRDYTNHSPSLSVRDLSNTSSTAESHYNHHSFAAMAATPHNFFRDFRDLQTRMLGAAAVQDYGVHNHHHASLASRHIAQLSGMDMTNQRLINPGSPHSPYNQSSPHMNLDNLSPMSRHSYEDMGGGQQQIPNSSNPTYQPAGQVGGVSRNVPAQGIEGNNKDPGNEQMSGGVPYEMRVAAN